MMVPDYDDIASSTCPSSVELNCATLDAEGLDALSAAFIRNQSIHHLCLQNINEGHLTELIDALINNSCIIQLDLRYNRVSDVGAQILARLLIHNPRIQYLHLYGNIIGPKGCR